MTKMFTGKVWKYGEHINTDVILPARYLTSHDPDVLKNHCMEDLDPEFRNNVKPGDIIVGLRDFGCGSSREHAPLAIKAVGVHCIIAVSFARIFYRNAINIGLPVLICHEAALEAENGDELDISLSEGTIINLRTGKKHQAQAYPDFMRDIIFAGGLVPYMKRQVQRGNM